MQTQVEELADNKVRLSVEVPREDVRHAVDHAAEDLAASLKIPGFRKGKVPMPVLLARVGRDRLYAEAVESHIGSWFRNAVVSTRVQPVERPQYEYDLPDSADEGFRFTATFAVQPRPEVADWRELEVPSPDATVPEEAVRDALEQLARTVADLSPVEERAAQPGDVLVVDLLAPDGEARRDYVVEAADPRYADSLSAELVGMTAGASKTVDVADDPGAPSRIEIRAKELYERVLPPIDDDFARAASEYETLDELRADVEERLREQIEEAVEAEVRAAAVEQLVDASGFHASGPLVENRARELLVGMARSLERRGVSLETYLAASGQPPEELERRLVEQAERSVSRELVLEAVAEQLGLEVPDEELRAFIREQAEAAGEEDPDAVVERIWESGRQEGLREDLRLRAAVDRIAAEVKRIPAELARAREKLWTPDKGERPKETTLWTPGGKEPR